MFWIHGPLLYSRIITGIVFRTKYLCLVEVIGGVCMKTVEDQVRPGESLLQVLEKLPVLSCYRRHSIKRKPAPYISEAMSHLSPVR
jgi:hypothetical protein